MYKFIILVILLFTFSCTSLNYSYVKSTRCKNKIERHYDTKGHYTGSTWTTVCD